jgi:hypothetical protein
MSQSTTTKPAKELSMSQIVSKFNMPMYQACIELKTSYKRLRRRCKELGIERWPYRKRACPMTNTAITLASPFHSFDLKNSICKPMKMGKITNHNIRKSNGLYKRIAANLVERWIKYAQRLKASVSTYFNKSSTQLGGESQRLPSIHDILPEHAFQPLNIIPT